MILKGVAKSGKPFASSYPINMFTCASIYVKQGLSSKLHIGLRPHPSGLLIISDLQHSPEMH